MDETGMWSKGNIRNGIEEPGETENEYCDNVGYLRGMNKWKDVRVR